MDFKFWKKQPPSPTQPPPQWGLRETPGKSLYKGCIARYTGQLKFPGRGFRFELTATVYNAEYLSAMGYQSCPNLPDAIARLQAAERRPEIVKLISEIFIQPPANSFIRVVCSPVTEITNISKPRILLAAPVRISKHGFDNRILVQKILRAIAIKMEVMDHQLTTTLARPNLSAMAMLTDQTFRHALMRECDSTLEFYLIAILDAFRESTRPK